MTAGRFFVILLILAPVGLGYQSGGLALASTVAAISLPVALILAKRWL